MQIDLTKSLGFIQDNKPYQGGLHSTMASILASGRSCPGFESKHSRSFFGDKIFAVSEVNQHHCIEESGQWL